MKVTLTKGAYNYFKNLIEGNGQRLIESWKEYIEHDEDHSIWGELYNKVFEEVEFSSAQMVAKLLRGEIEIEEKKEPTRFVYYMKQGLNRRYYGAIKEVYNAWEATWYHTGNQLDGQHMEALENLGWIKISLEQALKQDK